jgi:flagellar biosynthesis/type III secretory pathway protein FliH
MTDTSNMVTPAWAKKQPNTGPVLYSDWSRPTVETKELAWGSDGLQAAVIAEEITQEPEIQECPLCEETREKGAAELAEKVQEMESTMDASIGEFTKSLKGISRSIDGDVVRLAKILAERIIGETIELDPSFLERNLAAALRKAGPLVNVTLKVCASDLDRIRDIAPAMAEEVAGGHVELTIQPSSEVEKGGVIVVYQQGMVDARFGHQLESVTQVVAEMVAQGDGRKERAQEEEGES